MRGIGLVSSNRHPCFFLLLTAAILALTGCSRNPSVPVRTVLIQQAWELQPGNTVGGHPVMGGLGDISIKTGGDRIYAPFTGKVEPNNLENCYIFSSPDVPAYLFRYCGLRDARVGPVKQGETIGRADYLEFAALRRQPDGKWTMVEPGKDVLERSLISR